MKHLGYLALGLVVIGGFIALVYAVGLAVGFFLTHPQSCIWVALAAALFFAYVTGKAIVEGS